MNQDPAPRLHYCFLASPSLFLHPLTSLISNCLKLSFGTQGISQRLFPTNEKHQTERLPCSRAPTGSCSVSQPSLLSSVQFSSVQSFNRVRLFATPWTTQNTGRPCPSPSLQADFISSWNVKKKKIKVQRQSPSSP